MSYGADTDAEIRRGLAHGLWYSAYGAFVSEIPRGQRGDWPPSEDPPEVPEPADDAADDLAELLIAANNVPLWQLLERAYDAEVIAVDRGHSRAKLPSRKEWVSENADWFGYYLAMQSLGEGVSWFDDHARFPITFPLAFECHFDGDDLTWSGRNPDGDQETKHGQMAYRPNPSAWGIVVHFQPDEDWKNDDQIFKALGGYRNSTGSGTDMRTGLRDRTAQYASKKAAMNAWARLLAMESAVHGSLEAAVLRDLSRDDSRPIATIGRPEHWQRYGPYDDPRPTENSGKPSWEVEVNYDFEWQAVVVIHAESEDAAIAKTKSLAKRKGWSVPATAQWRATRVNPIVHGHSPQAISENIRRLMAEGKPQKQAVAIALETARQNPPESPEYREYLHLRSLPQVPAAKKARYRELAGRYSQNPAIGGTATDRHQRITAFLDEQGIPWKLSDDGTTIWAQNADDEDTGSWCKITSLQEARRYAGF